MKPDEIKQLLGGYATGTLTPDERKLLFDAALEDQELFDALAREDALREALEEPAVRRELIRTLEPEPSWHDRFDRFRVWTRWQYPVGAGALALAAITFVAIVRYGGPSAPESEPVQVAEVRRPAAPETRALSPPPVLSEESRAAAPRAVIPAPRADASKARSDAPQPRAFRPPPPTADDAATVLLEPETPKIVAPESPVRRIIRAAPLAAPPPDAQASKAESIEAQERALQTAIRSADTEAPRQKEARDLFYGLRPSGVVGGVIGGVPGGLVPGRSKAPATLGRGEAAAQRVLEPLGLRTQVSKSAAGVEVVLESNVDAVAYLFRRASNGDWVPVAPGGLSLKAHVPVTAPAFSLVATSAALRSIAVLSRRPLPELARTGTALSEAIAALQSGADVSRLVTESVGNSMFNVVPLPSPSEVIVVPLAIP